MLRLLVAAITIFVVLWVLVYAHVLPAPLNFYAMLLVNSVASLACPLSIFLLLFAPGLFRRTSEEFRQFWERITTRRRVVEDLERKIANMDKPHHMTQLGNVLLAQGRLRKAIPWFEAALQREPDSLEARYKLALCWFDLRDYSTAAELLEQVHAEKPDHDYGMAYLRLAEAQQRLGDLVRAAAVYDVLLRYYPGQPEGTYHFGLLRAAEGDLPVRGA